MALKFRNIDASPDDPVESWPQEGIQAALERGSLSDWRRIQRAVERAPWGPVARSLEQVLTYCRPYGVAGLMERGLARARAATEQAERNQVAARVRQAIAVSGLDRRRFAEVIGTSVSRLSTYATGGVCPSAAMLIRIEGVAQVGRQATNPGRVGIDDEPASRSPGRGSEDSGQADARHVRPVTRPIRNQEARGVAPELA